MDPHSYPGKTQRLVRSIFTLVSVAIAIGVAGCPPGGGNRRPSSNSSSSEEGIPAPPESLVRHVVNRQAHGEDPAGGMDGETMLDTVNWLSDILSREPGLSGGGGSRDVPESLKQEAATAFLRWLEGGAPFGIRTERARNSEVARFRRAGQLTVLTDSGYWPRSPSWDPPPTSLPLQRYTRADLRGVPGIVFAFFTIVPSEHPGAEWDIHFRIEGTSPGALAEPHRFTFYAIPSSGQGWHIRFESHITER